MSRGAEGRTALLLLDYQESVVAWVGDDGALGAARRAADAARASGTLVLFAGVDFRVRFPEISPMNKMFGGLPSRAVHGPDGLPGTAVHAALGRRDDEPFVAKRRVSAFTGSDLEVVLRASGVSRLALAGISTSGVVLSTLLQAADLDYDLTILSDACADADPVAHAAVLEHVAPMHAAVTTVDEWAAGTSTAAS